MAYEILRECTDRMENQLTPSSSSFSSRAKEKDLCFKTFLLELGKKGSWWLGKKKGKNRTIKPREEDEEEERGHKRASSHFRCGAPRYRVRRQNLLSC